MSIRLIPMKMHIPSPSAVQVILGQARFIKTVEDLHEALVTAVPGINFGLAFCEASEPCLVRWTGTDQELTALAKTNVLHCPIAGLFPLQRPSGSPPGA